MTMIGMMALTYLFLAGLGAFLYMYMVHPVIFIHLYFRISVWLSGLKLKYVNIDDMTICYGEKGKRRKGQPSMILLHGFTACKFMWSPLAKNLSHDCHVIAVDLPGHGDSDTPTEDEDISHTTTVKKMNQIICRLGLEEEPFHLVGMSMGGALAGLYAAQYPEHIHSLTLICPAMRTPIESPFWGDIHAALEQGMTNLHEKCTLLFPQSAHQVQDMLRFVQFNNSWVPKQILQGVVDFRKNYYPFYARLFNMIAQPDNHHLLRDCATKITAPTQIIWGEEDQVIHASGAAVLKELLPNCVRVDLIPRCGHSMSTDRPGAMTKALLTFRSGLEQKTR
ncbi:monoacylglycerol lipase abhd6-B-like [Mya arenaria]|uniref:monoacylglycerol lipase abhd6-B-like n=1 Tax=Mya arenaria TaxID=6604 RepID=UPI0022DFFCB8|nr:monoacylglycerol lipase abhd6-B-like [Mya arenaria]